MIEKNTDSAAKELWESAKAIYVMSLKDADEKNQVERYLEMVTSVTIEGNVFSIFTNTEFAAELIKENYVNKLKGCFMVAGGPADLDIVVKYDNPRKAL